MTNMKFIVLLPIVIFLTIHFDFIEGRSINLKKNFHQFKDNITKSNIECGVNYKCTDCSVSIITKSWLRMSLCVLYMQDSSYIGKINSLTISPDPPSRPTITVEASLSLGKYNYTLLAYNLCYHCKPYRLALPNFCKPVLFLF